VSLTVPPGRTVALVGPSGSGKSTLVNLTLRFFDPDRGKVKIDGQDISKVTIASLRDAIALVTQDPLLFDDTIRANIAYGTKAVDEAQIVAAAKAAAAHDFIMALPKGYDTRVGEAGSALSGGERQRIAIARAVYKDAPILLLDEPTSSLDSEAEAKVQTALEGLMRGRTVLMIAHRLSTVKKADLICVLDQGRIVEVGRHDELVAKGGLYTRLHSTQFGIAGAYAGDEIAAGDLDGDAIAVAGN
jgi:subfamily B ATP-binding cassette protein MsbA